MDGSCARNGAASLDPKSVSSGRRKLLNKKRGVSPQAILCSVALCGAAFAYALSVADSSSPSLSGTSASLAGSTAENIAAASAVETSSTDRSANVINDAQSRSSATAHLTQAQPTTRPRLQASAQMTIDANDPRWAKDVEPVEDEFDWQGRLALSADGQKIVMRGRQRGQTNPLIKQGSAAQPEFAYAESPRQLTGESSTAQAAQELVDARTRSAVNMRAAGQKNATVITVVPGGAAVRVEQDCQHWCASVYEDKQGYIYKTYLTVVDMGSTASVTPQVAPAQADQVPQSARNEMRAEDYAPSRLR